jgi:hypothetical protein
LAFRHARKNKNNIDTLEDLLLPSLMGQIIEVLTSTKKAVTNFVSSLMQSKVAIEQYYLHETKYKWSFIDS